VTDFRAHSLTLYGQDEHYRRRRRTNNPATTGDFCTHCHTRWPCDTIRLAILNHTGQLPAV
jgi:hypothetical protein